MALLALVIVGFVHRMPKHKKKCFGCTTRPALGQTEKLQQGKGV